MPKFYTTRYALTKGIQTVDADEPSDGMVVDRRNHFPTYYHGEGKQWHRTREGAMKRAEEMRSHKIASFNKSIDKLKKLDFMGTSHA